MRFPAFGAARVAHLRGGYTRALSPRLKQSRVNRLDDEIGV